MITSNQSVCRGVLFEWHLVESKFFHDERDCSSLSRCTQNNSHALSQSSNCWFKVCVYEKTDNGMQYLHRLCRLSEWTVDQLHGVLLCERWSKVGEEKMTGCCILAHARLYLSGRMCCNTCRLKHFIYAGLDGCLALEKKSHDLSPEGAGAGNVRILLAATFRETRPHSGALCNDMCFNPGFVLYCMLNARHQAKSHCHRMIVSSSGMDDGH